MLKTIPSAPSMDRGGNRKQSVDVVLGLMVLYPCVVRYLTTLMNCMWIMLHFRPRGINNYYDL